jgi:hypothetical protein
MELSAKRRSNGIGKWLKVLTLASVLLASALTVNRQVAASSKEIAATSSADLVEGIVLTPSVTDADAAYLTANLTFLHDHLPAWWRYIQDAKPFALSIDLRAGAQGRAAFTRCCEGTMA